MNALRTPDMTGTLGGVTDLLDAGPASVSLRRGKRGGGPDDAEAAGASCPCAAFHCLAAASKA